MFSIDAYYDVVLECAIQPNIQLGILNLIWLNERAELYHFKISIVVKCLKTVQRNDAIILQYILLH